MAYDFRSGGYVKFVRCVTAAWNSLATKDNDTLYFVYENNAATGSLYLGNRLISGGVSSTFSLSDLQDVLIASDITSNSLLVYDNTQDKWVSKSLNEVFEEISSSVMVGATTSTDGVQGLVPVPTAGQQNLFLRGDATWANPTAELQVQVGNLASGLATVQGSDTTKSMRTVAQEEVAAIVDGADSSFDTLKEIAQWISTHQDTADVVTLQNDVKNLKDLMNGTPAETDPDSGEVITPAVPGLVTRVGNLETSMTSVQSDVSGLQSVTSTLQTDVDSLKTRMTSAESAISDIDGRLRWQDLVEA